MSAVMECPWENTACTLTGHKAETDILPLEKYEKIVKGMSCKIDGFPPLISSYISSQSTAYLHVVPVTSIKYCLPAPCLPGKR